MIKQLAILAATLGWLTSAQATVLTVDFPTPSPVPDGTPIGWTSTITVNDPNATYMENVALTLDISGGWNGDLYAYLLHNNDAVVLLNHPGKTAANPLGYGDAGLHVTFSDTAPNGDIHTYQQTIGSTQPTSLWEPDKRTMTDLLLITDQSPRDGNGFSIYNTKDANGTWTLFIADLASGGQSQVNSWSLDIQTKSVPEPASFAFGLAAAMLALLHRRLARFFGR